METLINFDELSDALSEFNSTNDGKAEELLTASMSEEMQASQRRYEEYIKKHED